jgi:hypothetical protein
VCALHLAGLTPKPCTSVSLLKQPANSVQPNATVQVQTCLFTQQAAPVLSCQQASRQGRKIPIHADICSKCGQLRNVQTAAGCTRTALTNNPSVARSSLLLEESHMSWMFCFWAKSFTHTPQHNTQVNQARCMPHAEGLPGACNTHNSLNPARQPHAQQPEALLAVSVPLFACSSAPSSQCASPVKPSK